MKVGTGSSINTVNLNIGSTRKAEENSVAKIANQDQQKSQSNTVDKEKIEKALKIANMAYKEVNVECRYYIDERTNTEVVKFLNSENGEVIRQYPPEEILNMITRMYDMYGILLDEKV
jgi:flagellar protein FlaG